MSELTEEQIEERAQTLGWTPKEDFKGDPERWIDAKTFLERGEKELPIAKSNNERLHREISEMKETFKEFKEFHETSTKKAEQRGYEQAKKDLEAKRRAAVEESDTEAYDKVTNEIDELDKSYREAGTAKPQETKAPNNDVAYQNFISENQWYENDFELRALADNLAGFVVQTRPDLYGKSFYDEVKRQVKEMRPAKFENPNRRLPGDEDGGYQTPPPKKQKTFDNLPAEAKAAWEKFNLQFGLTKEEYLANYDWE